MLPFGTTSDHVHPYDTQDNITDSVRWGKDSRDVDVLNVGTSIMRERLGQRLLAGYKEAAAGAISAQLPIRANCENFVFGFAERHGLSAAYQAAQATPIQTRAS